MSRYCLFQFYYSSINRNKFYWSGGIPDSFQFYYSSINRQRGAPVASLGTHDAVLLNFNSTIVQLIEMCWMFGAEEERDFNSTIVQLIGGAWII